MDNKFFKDLYNNRNIILALSRREFKNNYVGSSLGFVWSFIQPLALALILWSIFTFAFNSKSVGNIPFVLYLLTGLFPWNFFSDTMNQNTVIIQNYSYIVKKMPFQLSVLPIIKILSNLFIHSIFIVITIIFLLAYGIPFSIYWFQVLYYLFALAVLVLSFSWILSAIQVFFKDTAQIVMIIVQIGFWVTPIFWTVDAFPASMQSVININPVVYIVNGYRDSLLYNIPFWQKGSETLIFWTLTAITFFVASKIFSRLSPHFADVL